MQNQNTLTRKKIKNNLPKNAGVNKENIEKEKGVDFITYYIPVSNTISEEEVLNSLGLNINLDEAKTIDESRMESLQVNVNMGEYNKLLVVKERI